MAHIVFAFSIISSFFFIGKTYMTDRKRMAARISFGILFVFSALRYGYGNDYFTYMTAFDAVHNGTYSFGSEVIFEMLMKLFPNFFLFIIFASFVIIYPIYKLVEKYVDLKYLPIAIFVLCFNPYLFMMSLTSIRQFMAVAVFIWATYFSYKKKIVPYLILIACALMIHTSAIMLFPVYFIANGKKISGKLLAVILAVTLAFLVSETLFNTVVTSVLELIDKKNYIYYFQTSGGSSLRSVILSFIFLLYIVWNIPKLEGVPLMCAKIYLIGTIIGVLVYHVNMMGRLQFYFDIFSVVAIPAIMKYHFENTKNTLIGIIKKYIFPCLMFVTLMGRYVNFFSASLWESFSEYHTIFEVLL